MLKINPILNPIKYMETSMMLKKGFKMAYNGVNKSTGKPFSGWKKVVKNNEYTETFSVFPSGTKQYSIKDKYSVRKYMVKPDETEVKAKDLGRNVIVQTKKAEEEHFVSTYAERWLIDNKIGKLVLGPEKFTTTGSSLFHPHEIRKLAEI